jgi:integrase
MAAMTEERTPDWRYFGLLFPDPKGEPYHAKAIIDAFHDACDRARIERRRVHDLRHSNNRLMKDLDVPEDVRMARHGHSTREMDRRYGGASEVADIAAADGLEEAIG